MPWVVCASVDTSCKVSPTVIQPEASPQYMLHAAEAGGLEVPAREESIRAW
eukprot:CAMPEP_0177377324 /NCGR_PEP_ID=MMETSP0368-20130122/45710_1 /TAXON_ID=447022 ORGANISM="Scrippsiella hangoei-like, Strain SHHI-4" /NCGR_SAMPLE_ID=MMETSP0368 /ASSEMBLY_ACC=CAM_ASM_000363 /LENGTH=50 /DNA_ID=CAMNT_0018841139 /DNA_START=691 /DNA_END=843 /DNA_ORIENTATION=-